MTIFNYTAITSEGTTTEGVVEAQSEDSAIRLLQKRGLVISSIKSSDDVPFYEKNLKIFERVSNKDVVILSRQIATLFEAQVSALRVFRLLGAEVENPLLHRTLEEVAEDLQGGSAISKALEKHPKVFSPFYVNMVKAGEESGQLDKTFNYLADYLDRSYEVTSKARNALIYPAFVIGTFIAVMVVMLTTVIPRLSSILEDSGQEIPSYTKIVIGLSDFLVNYTVLLLILIVIGVGVLWKYRQSASGKRFLAHLKLSIPYVGDLFKKLYLSRIADNMNTMLSSGISMTRALEISGQVVGNVVYEDILNEALQKVRGGSSVADAIGRNDAIPNIMVQMVRIGEETGELGHILETLAHFYQREVNNAVDTLVDLIEPAMIVLLGLGVGILLASVLIPIYNISSGF